MENKEITPIKESLGDIEKHLKPVEVDLPIPKEIQTLMRKAEMPKIGDEKIILTPEEVKPSKKTELPVNQKQLIKGLGEKFSEAGRWLATFVLRLIKIKGGNVQFKKE